MKITRKELRGIILEGLNFDYLNNTVLLKCKEGNVIYYLLLDVKITELIDQLFGRLKEITDEDDWGNYTKTKPLISVLMSDYNHMIYGMAQRLHTRGPLNSSEIKMFAAQPGWGPTLYDIVMGDCDGIIADRNSVSPDAYAVYDYYNKNRPDIQRTPLDSVYHKWTPNPNDDTTWGASARYSNPYAGDTKDKTITRDRFINDPLNWVYNRDPVPGVEQAYSNSGALLAVFDKWSTFDPEDVLDYFTEKLALKFFFSKY